jgi:hypothetical protein
VAASRAASPDKPLLGNGVGLTTVNCIQHGDRVGEPRVDPARDQSLYMGGRNALTPPRRFSAPSHQAFGDVIAIADALLYRMSGRQRLALRIVDKPGEQAYVVTTVADSAIDPVCRQGRLNPLP